MLTEQEKNGSTLPKLNANPDNLVEGYKQNLHHALGKDEFTQTEYDQYLALAYTARDHIVNKWLKTKQTYHNQNSKRAYYLSMEFLIGRLMGNNMLNAGIYDQMKTATEKLNIDLEEVSETEPDAGLGNGGLGRLAACFLDSMATLGIPACGYGIRYDYGIFKQRIENGHQIEKPDHWLALTNPWEFERPEYAVPIHFYGRVNHYHDESGEFRAEWCDTQQVLAMPYDVPVPGYQNDTVNTLRLWSATSSEEFDLDYFNSGDYEKAVYGKMYSENISKVLYPNDSTAIGKELRLKQEYFFTAASLHDIVRRFLATNDDFNEFPNKASIQLNDTHPAIAVAELMRILIDIHHVSWDKAWDITTRTFAYTNHTVMPEALECWSVSLFEKLLPRHMQLIYEINARFLSEVSIRFKGDGERLRRMSIIEEGAEKRVRMAYLAIVCSYSVNGVSELHSSLLKTDLFKDFYELWPEKFNNKTNGITQRRWLLKSNEPLSNLISEKIGSDWVVHLDELSKLKKLSKDKTFQKAWQDAKLENKKNFADYLTKNFDCEIDPNSMIDVQVKRIHEYKRQMLFVLYIIDSYLGLKDGSIKNWVPRTFIISGKAAPGYAMAKLIIKFINNVSAVINQDPQVNDKIKLVFLENYRVSLAERIFPASDLSEQISTAGTEASGTGCMKFMLNGALTIGTRDGANIEMEKEMGSDNFLPFGLNIEEVSQLKAKGYHPSDYIESSAKLKEVFKLIENNFFSPFETDIFKPLLSSLIEDDPYLVCADFEDYCRAQEDASKLYANTELWTEKSIINVASCGKFSSDRTIKEYAEDIWDIKGQK